MAGNRGADYTGFICLPKLRKYAIAGFSKCVKQMKWERLSLENISLWNENHKNFIFSFKSERYHIYKMNSFPNDDQINMDICPCLPLPTSWDQYLTQKLNSNTRRKAKRYLEMVDNSEDYKVTHMTPDTFKRDMDIFLNFWQSKWSNRKGTQIETILNTFRNILTTCNSNGTLFIPVLWHNNNPIASIVCLIDEIKYTVMMFALSRDEAFRNPPPGILLNFYCIRHAIRQHFRYYDFLRGNEQYKYLFGCHERRIGHLVIVPKAQFTAEKEPQVLVSRY